MPPVPRLSGASAVPGATAGSGLRVLLVEDDDGDALIVEDLLETAAAPFHLTHVRSLAEAVEVAAEHDCALLDLNLPDATGVTGLERLRAAGNLAILVLTGLDDERRGIEALAAGAQDYLIKGHVDGSLLARSIRYAVERRRAQDAHRQLALARVQAAENARLERGLLPTPLVGDASLEIAAHYRAGRRRALLGGDFYDVVEDRDDVVHALIGDVCGHGPDEAALGVALRIAWRTLVLSGAEPDAVFPTLQEVLAAERTASGVFTTLATLALDADRRGLTLRSAGHPAPLLLERGGARSLATRPGGPPIGVVDGARWTASRVELPPDWALLLYTDGVIEGRVGEGAQRLGEQRLLQLVSEARAAHPGDAQAVVQAVVERAEQLNGGPLLDDVALVLVASSGG